MAVNTSKTYRNQVLYSVFVRNHTCEGTFRALEKDLDRIKELGVDIIWLMPIHPIGVQARKGTVGSPYAISDYRKINPDLGTLQDFKHLVDAIHQRGMKCIIDVVYNHTSPDSWLAQNHPQWFYRKADGSFGNRVGDWTDIIDLDYNNRDLWTYQIDTLKMWAEIVDGFRCDVAPLVPLEFWLKARAEVETVRPNCIWLAESVEPHFITYNRSCGVPALSDSEVYQAFDICYDYDIFDIYREYLEGKRALSDYANAVTAQEGMYPDNYVKLRFLENHDRARAAHGIENEKALRNWSAFLYFQKGMTMVFAGQEVGAYHLPRLFEKDPVDWHSEKDYSDMFRTLYRMKQDKIFAEGAYSVQALPRDVLLATYESGEEKILGIFSVRGESSVVKVDLPDGSYENLLGSVVDIYDGRIGTQGEPIIIRKV